MPTRPSFPPSRDEQIKAVGNLGRRHLPRDDAHAREVASVCGDPSNWDALFESMADLGSEDWLAGPGRSDLKGQTYEGFRRQVARAAAPNKIYILGIGSLSNGGGSGLSPSSNLEEGKQAADAHSAPSVDIEDLVEYTRAYFMVDVEVLPCISDEKALTFRGNRSSPLDPNLIQLKTGACHKALLASKPADAFCVVGVTMFDLYPGAKWNFVFGQADPNQGTAVFSFARYTPQFEHGDSAAGRRQLRRISAKKLKETFLRRCIHVLVHEIGHLYALDHCIWFKCRMNGANNLEEGDTQPFHLCPVDLRKLHSRTKHGFSLEDRYVKLLEWYEDHDFKTEIVWLRKCLTVFDFLDDEIPKS